MKGYAFTFWSWGWWRLRVAALKKPPSLSGVSENSALIVALSSGWVGFPKSATGIHASVAGEDTDTSGMGLSLMRLHTKWLGCELTLPRRGTRLLRKQSREWVKWRGKSLPQHSALTNPQQDNWGPALLPLIWRQENKSLWAGWNSACTRPA